MLEDRDEMAKFYISEIGCKDESWIEVAHETSNGTIRYCSHSIRRLVTNQLI